MVIFYRVRLFYILVYQVLIESLYFKFLLHAQFTRVYSVAYKITYVTCDLNNVTLVTAPHSFKEL